jgi:Fe2+ transport system protein FeoA
MTSTVPAFPPVPLSRVPVGSRCVVRTVDDPASPAAAQLAREGLLPGATIEVASRTPLGGPVVVVLGRARLAISADVAACVLTDADTRDLIAADAATRQAGTGPLPASDH